MQYVREAVVYKEESGGYSVIFPSVEGAITQGETLYEALTNAESALAEIMIAHENFIAGRGKVMTNRVEQSGEEPQADFNSIHTLVKADTEVYRQKPSTAIELWYSPETKKYFTVLTDDEVEVKPRAEEMARKVSGVK